MKRRVFLVFVNGHLIGRAYAYNSAMRKGEAYIRGCLHSGETASYVSGVLNRETMQGSKLWRTNTGRDYLIEVAPGTD